MIVILPQFEGHQNLSPDHRASSLDSFFYLQSSCRCCCHVTSYYHGNCCLPLYYCHGYNYCDFCCHRVVHGCFGSQICTGYSNRGRCSGPAQPFACLPHHGSIFDQLGRFHALQQALVAKQRFQEAQSYVLNIQDGCNQLMQLSYCQ